MMKLTLLNLSSDFPRVKEVWWKLSQSSTPSYFLSWGWIEHWISCLPERAAVQLAVFSENDLPVLAFFMGQAKTVRHGAFRSRSLFLNASGVPLVDRLYIEYNSVLHAGVVNCSLDEILELLPQTWDEFWLPGLDANRFPGNALGQGSALGEIQIERDVPSPYVDLALVRQNQGDYVSLLSSSTRSLVRRSQRGYETRGPVRLEAAHDQTTATEIFNELVRLHKKTWQGQGVISSFESDFFQQFHQELIRKRLDSGEIQLLRISAGDTTIGCLYNFVFKGHIYGYQSGFQYEDDKHLTPGFTSFVEAIKYSAARGYDVYDFLGGDAAYKSRLCTNEQRLIWAKVQKPRIQFRLETRLKEWKHFAQSLRNEKSVVT